MRGRATTQFQTSRGQQRHAYGDLVWTNIVRAKNSGIIAVRFLGVNVLSDAALDDYHLQIEGISNQS